MNLKALDSLELNHAIHSIQLYDSHKLHKQLCYLRSLTGVDFGMKSALLDCVFAISVIFPASHVNVYGSNRLSHRIGLF